MVDKVKPIVLDLLKEISKLSMSELEFSNANKNSEALGIVKKHTEGLDKELSQRIYDEFFCYGPLQKLIDDKRITEIIVTDIDNIWVEREGMIELYHDRFMSQTSFNNCLNRIYQDCNVDPSVDNPFITTKWKGFRIHVVRQSLVSAQTQVTFRRTSSASIDIEFLKQSGFANDKEIDMVSEFLKKKNNILIIGETSSGKTTFLSALLNLCNDNERVLILEDACEITKPNKVSAKLLTRNNPNLSNISLNDLIYESLRMRPDRIVLGELRGSEAKDYLLALSTGHKGCLCTLHASSAREALIRLEFLVQLGASSWSIFSIRRLISLSIEYIVMVGRGRAGKRKLLSIDKLCTFEENQILLEEVYKR